MTSKKDLQYINVQKRFYLFFKSQAFGFEKLFMPDPVPYRLTYIRNPAGGIQKKNSVRKTAPAVLIPLLVEVPW